MTLALNICCLAGQAAIPGLRHGVPGVCMGLPAEVSCSAAGQPVTQPDRPGEHQHGSGARGVSEPRLASHHLSSPPVPAPVAHTRQSSKNSTWLTATENREGGESLQESALEALLSLPHPSHRFA